MKIRPAWGSHIPLLIKSFEVTTGPVLELGEGIYSTPILHWMCFNANRKLVSFENDKKYYTYFWRFRGEYHENFLIRNWERIDIENTKWGFALNDVMPPADRAFLARRLAKNTDIILLHDTQPEEDKVYKYSKLYPEFKYVYHYRKRKPYTTALSNTMDVGQLFKDFYI